MLRLAINLSDVMFKMSKLTITTIHRAEDGSHQHGVVSGFPVHLSDLCAKVNVAYYLEQDC